MTAVGTIEEGAVKTVRLTRARRMAILKALADPRRFELLERIAKAACPLGCAEAREALPISAATLSHHIKELETAGLIAKSVYQEHPVRYAYRLTEEGKALRDVLGAFARWGKKHIPGTRTLSVPAVPSER